KLMKNIQNWLNWKKILILLSGLIGVAIISYLIYLYVYIENSKVINESKTEQFILEETDMKTIEKIYQFHGEETFHIVIGKDSNNTQLYVFVPLSKKLDKNNIQSYTADQFLSQEQIEKNWSKDCSGCNLLGSTPAMINKNPLWELTYKDPSNRYVITYISLEDGSIYEQLRLYRKYSEKG